MNTYLLADVDYPGLTAYINQMYDPDNGVLTSQMLGTHLHSHVAALNDQGEDPDPIITSYLMVDPSFQIMYVPVILDRVGYRVTWDNGLVCECPLVVLMSRIVYEHFYRQ